MAPPRGPAGRGRLAGMVIVLLAVGGLVSCAQSPSGSGSDASVSTPVSSPAADDTAAATPTPSVSATSAPTSSPPPLIAEPDTVGQSSEQASAQLTQHGLLVAFSDASGTVLPSVSGWSVIGEQPVAGTRLSPGSTVRLILQPPAPPPPPAAPAPAPAAPAVPPPAQDPAATGATALCNDGTLSYSAHHQGTCSHHDGVAQWYK